VNPNVRFRGEADVDRGAASFASVVNDPLRSLTRPLRCSAVTVGIFQATVSAVLSRARKLLPHGWLRYEDQRHRACWRQP
jgi:hypothetical protein